MSNPDALQPLHLPAPAPVLVRLATTTDLPFLIHLQKRYGEEVGFMPAPALYEHCLQGHVTLAVENDQPAGYLISRAHLRWQPLLSPIYQAAVCHDAQRRHIGAALVARLVAEANHRELAGIQANCAVGVPANEFWSALGFVPICHFRTNAKRGRELICWRRPLIRKLPAWFANPPHHAGFPPRAPILTRNPDRKEAAREIAKKYISTRRPPPPHTDR